MRSASTSLEKNRSQPGLRLKSSKFMHSTMLSATSRWYCTLSIFFLSLKDNGRMLRSNFNNRSGQLLMHIFLSLSNEPCTKPSWKLFPGSFIFRCSRYHQDMSCFCPWPALLLGCLFEQEKHQNKCLFEKQKWQKKNGNDPEGKPTSHDATFTFSLTQFYFDCAVMNADDLKF